MGNTKGLIGDIGCGKKSLLKRICNNQFEDIINIINNEEQLSSLSVGLKTFDLDSTTEITLDIWILHHYPQRGKYPFRGSNGFLVCYDCTNQKSFWNARKWILEIERYGDEEAPIIILETKNDLTDRTVSLECGRILTNSTSVVGFISTSAKTGENVEIAFMDLAKILYKVYCSENPPNDTNYKWSPTLIQPPLYIEKRKIMKKKKGKNEIKEKKIKNSLFILPEDLLSSILSSLNLYALIRLSHTCKFFHQCLWNHVKVVDFTKGDNWNAQILMSIFNRLPSSSKAIIDIYNLENCFGGVDYRGTINKLLYKADMKNISVSITTTDFYPYKTLPDICYHPAVTEISYFTITHPRAMELVNLKSVSINSLTSLVALSDYVSLEHLHIKISASWKTIKMISKLTNLKSLTWHDGFIRNNLESCPWLYSLTKIKTIELNETPIPHTSDLPTSLRSLNICFRGYNAELTKYSALKAIYLNSTVDFRSISGLTQLEKLHVPGVDDRTGLEGIEKFSNLFLLELPGMLCFSESLSKLIQLTQLQVLDISKTKVHGLDEIFSHLISLKSLNLNQTEIVVSSIQYITLLQELNILDLSCNNDLNDDIFPLLCHLCSLESLNLSHLNKITQKGVESLSSLNLLFMDLSQCWSILQIKKSKFYHTSITFLEPISRSMEYLKFLLSKNSGS